MPVVACGMHNKGSPGLVREGNCETHGSIQNRLACRRLYDCYTDMQVPRPRWHWPCPNGHNVWSRWRSGQLWCTAIGPGTGTQYPE